MDDTNASQDTQTLPELSAGINSETGELVFNQHVITRGTPLFQLLGRLMGLQPIDKTELDSIVVSNSIQRESGGLGIAPGGLPDHVNSEHDEQRTEQVLQGQVSASAGPILQLSDPAAEDSRIGVDGTVQTTVPLPGGRG